MPQKWQQWPDETGSGGAIANKFNSTSLLSQSYHSTAVKHGPCLLTEKKSQAFETKCMRKLLRISFLEQKTNDWVRSKISSLVGGQEPPLATVKRRKLAWFGHVTRYDSLSKTLEFGIRCGWQKKCWLDNIKQGPPAEMTRRGSLFNRPSCPPDEQIGQGTELN